MREVAILPGYGGNPYEEPYRLLGNIAYARYGEANTHLIEIDWDATFPEWCAQVESTLVSQRRSNESALDVIGYSMGGLLALYLSSQADKSFQWRVDKLAMLSVSCWAGSEVRERVQNTGARLPPEQLEALRTVDVLHMANRCTAAQIHIFYGAKELPLMQDMSISLAQMLKKPNGNNADERFVTVTSIPNARHSDALGIPYLDVVRARL